MYARTSQHRISAVAAKFPFLFTTDESRSSDWSPYLRRQSVQHLSVARVSRELLASRPRYEGAEGSLVSVSDDQQFVVLDSAGNFLCEVKQDEHVYRPGADGTSREGETVAEAIVRAGVTDRAAMVLERHRGYEIEDHRSVGGYAATLYLSPKDFSIADFCEREVALATSQLEAEVDGERGVRLPRVARVGCATIEPLDDILILRLPDATVPLPRWLAREVQAALRQSLDGSARSAVRS